MVEVILHLLDPTLPEFSASYVGKLVVVLIQKVCVCSPVLVTVPVPSDRLVMPSAKTCSCCFELY